MKQEVSELVQRLVEVKERFEKLDAGARNEKERRLYRELRQARVKDIIEEVSDKQTIRLLFEAIGIRTIDLSQKDFGFFRDLQVKYRPDWQATFTAEFRGGIFPQVRWGRTPYEERLYVQGFSELLDRIARLSLNLRGSGGRFFISRNGVFYKGETGLPHQFIRFEFE